MTEAELKQRYSEIRGRLRGLPPRQVVKVTRLAPVTPEEIPDEPLDYHGADETFLYIRDKYHVKNIEIIETANRNKAVIEARQELVYLLVTKHQMPYYHIAKIMGGNHTSAMARHKAYLKQLER